MKTEETNTNGKSKSFSQIEKIRKKLLKETNNIEKTTKEKTADLLNAIETQNTNERKTLFVPEVIQHPVIEKKPPTFLEIAEKLEKLASLRAKRERLFNNLQQLRSFEIEEGEENDENERGYTDLTIHDSKRQTYTIKNPNTIIAIIDIIIKKSEIAISDVEIQLVNIF